MSLEQTPHPFQDHKSWQVCFYQQIERVFPYKCVAEIIGIFSAKSKAIFAASHDPCATKQFSEGLARGHRAFQPASADGSEAVSVESGEGGIRTLGTLLGYGALAKRCFRPLSHLTNSVREYERRGGSSTMRVINGAARE